jgi:hypothetical protein
MIVLENMAIMILEKKYFIEQNGKEILQMIVINVS